MAEENSWWPHWSSCGNYSFLLRVFRNFLTYLPRTLNSLCPTETLWDPLGPSACHVFRPMVPDAYHTPQTQHVSDYSDPSPPQTCSFSHFHDHPVKLDSSVIHRLPTFHPHHFQLISKTYNSSPSVICLAHTLFSTSRDHSSNRCKSKLQSVSPNQSSQWKIFITTGHHFNSFTQKYFTYLLSENHCGNIHPSISRSLKPSGKENNNIQQ